MKSLIAIWVFVAVVLVTGTAWVNAEINKRVVVELPTSSNGQVLQPTIDGSQLQPARSVEPNFTTTYNPQQTINGNELQGAR